MNHALERVLMACIDLMCGIYLIRCVREAVALSSSSCTTSAGRCAFRLFLLTLLSLLPPAWASIYECSNYPLYLWGGSFLLKALPLTLLTLRAGKLVSTYSVVQRHW